MKRLNPKKECGLNKMGFLGLKETVNEIILLPQERKNTSSICVSLVPMTSQNPNPNKGIESRKAALDVGHDPCDLSTLDEFWHIILHLGG